MSNAFPSLAFSFLVLQACETTEVNTINRCNIEISPIEEPLYFGETVNIDAYPMTEKWDTLVSFNETEAVIESVAQDNCEACEECRESNGCTDCDYCTDCTISCESCTHTVTVVIPTDAAIESQLVITNSHGTSDPLPVTLEEAP